MTTKKAAVVQASLVRKGMILKKGHHKIFRLEIDGVTTVITRISHGENELGDTLLAEMAKQVKLNKKQFLDLIECPLSQAEWIEIIKSKSA